MTANRLDSNSELRDKISRTDGIIDGLLSRYRDGDPAAELIEELKSIWDGYRVPNPSSANQEELARIQGRITSAIEIASVWMSSTTEELNRLARGRRMRHSYIASNEI